MTSDQWDFFVSYTQADRAWAEWVAWTLEEAGYRVLVQAWDFVPGSNWVQRMQDGVAGAARTVVVLSPDYLGSVFGGAEWQAAWAADPAGRGRKLLTVRVAECDRPGLLGQVVGVDLFAVAEAKARSRLRDIVARAIAGRAKPATAPDFPGGRGRAINQEARFPGALPRVWNVPARNPNFTGRVDDLAAMTRELTAQGLVTVAAVHGMGGVGTTALANEYAYTRSGAYDLVWWIAADEPALIQDGFARLAKVLGIAPERHPQLFAATINNVLREVSGWLLVFDNANEADDLQPWLPSVSMPPGIPGHIIVTTRRGGFDALGPVRSLDVVDERGAVALLRSRVPELDETVGQAIAAELGRLPLALEQASAHLYRSEIQPEEYLKLLRTRKEDSHLVGTCGGGNSTIATPWAISLSRVANTNPASRQLLDICAVLAPEAVPQTLLTRHPEKLPRPLASVATDELLFTEVVDTLVDYSLLRRTERGLLLHRLIHAATLGKLRSHAISYLTTQERVLELLRSGLPTLLKAERGAPIEWRALLPHVLHVLKQAMPSIHDLSKSVRATYLWLVEGSVKMLLADGLLEECEDLLGRGIAVAKLNYGDVSAQLPPLLIELSWVCSLRGESGTAERHASDAQSISEELYGPRHSAVAAAVGNRGRILSSRGEYARAEPLLERALSIDEQVYGNSHPEIIARLSDLGRVCWSLGDPIRARPLLERALEIDEMVHGVDHPEIAIRLSNLASVLLELGQPGQARPLLERAVEIDERAFGSDNPVVAVRLNNLAGILRDLGQPRQARPLLERALAIDEAVHGPDHPAVATRLSNLALVLRDLGQPQQARPLLERALAIDEAVYGPDHATVATRLGNIALVLQDLGQPQQARPLLERALAINEAAHGPDHATVATSLSNLALVLRDLGQPQQARSLLERALAINEAVHGPRHPQVAISLGNLALVLRDLGQSQQARPLLERALAIGDAAWGPQHPSTQVLRTNLQTLGGSPGASSKGQIKR